MRIVLLTIGFPPDTSTGGVATFYWQLAHGLKKAGHELLVVTVSNQEEGEYEFEGIRVLRSVVRSKIPALGSVHRPLGASQSALCLAFDLFENSKQKIIEFEPDVIESPDYCGMGLLFAVDKRFPLVVRCMGPLSYMMENGLLGPFSSIDHVLVAGLEEGAIRAASAVTSLSRNLASLYSSKFDLAQNAIEVIPPPFEIMQQDSLQTVPSLPDSTAFPRLAFWGRVEYLKGCDLLIESMPRVLEKFPGAKLTLIGRTSHLYYDEIDFAQRLKMRAEELGVSESINFAGEFQWVDAAQLAANSDICIFPSRYDTFPYAVIEAMAHGACVLSTDAGGIPECVEHAKSGWIVPNDDGDSLAAGIINLAQNEDLRATLKINAPSRVQTYCNTETMIARSLDLYDRAREAHKKGAALQQAGIDKYFARIHNAFFDQSIEEFIAARIRDVATESFEQGYAAGFQAAESQTMQLPAQLNVDL